MFLNTTLSSRMKLQRFGAVAIAAALLFSVNVLSDQILLWRGVQAAETFLNDTAIATVGGITVWGVLVWQARKQEIARIQERARLNAEMNYHIREAFSVMANAVLLKNEGDRLRAIDDAMQRVDRVLTEIVPSMCTGNPSEPSIAAYRGMAT